MEKTRIETLLAAWARWSAAGGRKALGYPSVSPMFRDAPSGKSYDSIPPAGLGSSDMHQIDTAINALPGVLRLTIIEVYLFGGDLRAVGKRMGISHVSVGRFIDKAYEKISENMQNICENV